MATLDERMARKSEEFAEQVPAEALEIMGAHTRKLEREGLADGAVGVGDRAPDFSLPNPKGETVALGDLLARGPVILSFYRGRW